MRFCTKPYRKRQIYLINYHLSSLCDYMAEAKDEKKPNRISPFSPEARVPLPSEIDEK